MAIKKGVLLISFPLLFLIMINDIILFKSKLIDSTDELWMAEYLINLMNDRQK